MIKHRKSSIKQQMFVIIILGVLIPLSLLIIISGIKFNSFASDLSKQKAIQHAQNYAEDIHKILSNTFAAADNFADIQSSMVSKDGISGFSIDEIHRINKQILNRHKYILDVYNNYFPNRIILPETNELNENLVLYGDVHTNGTFSVLKYNNYHFKSNIKDTLKEGNGYLLLPPYYDVINGDSIFMITYGHQITYKNEIIGLTGIDISVKWIQDYIKKASLFNGAAEINIITGKGIIIGNNKKEEIIGKHFAEVFPEIDTKFLRDDKEIAYIDEQDNFQLIVPITFETLKNPMYILITAPKSMVLKESRIDFLKRVSFAAIILIFALLVTYFYSQNIIKRISNLATITKRLSKGHLRVEFNDKGSDEIKELSDSIKAMIERFINILSSIKNTTDKLYTSSNDLSNVAVKLSEGASEQASSTQEVSASMEQMTAIIEQNSENAKIADKMARKSANGIAISSKNVIQTTNSMGEIANKTSIIGDIAFQTNILALNAAVEAARAGIHGKGFGVVAAEVGKLAENSKKAANEINELTDKSFLIAKKSGEMLKQITPDIAKTAQLVQEITNASLEQKSGTEQINNAIQQLNNITQENAGSAELLAVNVEVLNALADKLNKLLNFFKLEEKTKKRELKQTDKNSNEQKNIKLKKKEETKNVKPINPEKNKTIENTKENTKENTQKPDLIEPKGFNLNLDDESDDEFEKF